MLWIRLGDNGDYESFDDLDAAIACLNEGRAGLVTAWVNENCGIGIETTNYSGDNCISLYWGDKQADFVRELDASERKIVEQNLLAVED